MSDVLTDRNFSQRQREFGLQQLQFCDLRDPRCGRHQADLHEFLLESASVRPPLWVPEHIPADMVPGYPRYVRTVIHQRMPCDSKDVVFALPNADRGRPADPAVFTSMEQPYGAPLEPSRDVGCNVNNALLMGPQNIAGRFRTEDQHSHMNPLFLMRTAYEK